AADGIRDFHVTGVQTCALPIYDLDAPRVDGLCLHGGEALDQVRHRFVRPDDHGDIRLRHGHDSPSSLPPQRWNISPVSPHSLLGRWQFARTGCLTPLFPCFTSQGPVPLNGHGKGLGPRGSTPRGPSPVERAGGQPAAMPSASPFAVAWTGTASTISTSG